MAVRRVSIGAESMDKIKELLQGMLDQANRGEEPTFYVDGNGAHNLELAFVNEGPEFEGVVLVDFSES